MLAPASSGYGAATQDSCTTVYEQQCNTVQEQQCNTVRNNNATQYKSSSAKLFKTLSMSRYVSPSRSKNVTLCMMRFVTVLSQLIDQEDLEDLLVEVEAQALELALVTELLLHLLADRLQGKARVQTGPQTSLLQCSQARMQKCS